MSDKDAATLKAHTITFVADWLKACMPPRNQTQLPSLEEAVPALEGVAAPETEPIHVDIQAEDNVGAVENILRIAASGCSKQDVKNYNLYLTACEASPQALKTLVDQLRASDSTPPPVVNPFGSWGAAHSFLVRGRARAMFDAVQSTAAAIPSCKLVHDVDKALAGLKLHAFSLHDSHLARFAKVLIDRKAVLCFFHAKKAMLEWTTQQHILPPAEKEVWENEITPALTALFIASTDEIDSTWAEFQEHFGTRYPKFVKYMADEWMCPKWRGLWTKSGRYSIGHFMIETSNIAEVFFKVFKNDVLHKKMPTDLVDFFRLLYGLPLDSKSQVNCYLHTMLLELINTYRGLSSRVLSNTKLPSRKHVDPLREHFGNLISLPGSVRSLGNGFYAVANKTGRIKLGVGDELDDCDMNIVSIYHDLCPCKERASHCKHVLAARYFHLVVLKLPPTWADAELCLVYPNEHTSTLASAVDIRGEILGLRTVEIPLTPAQLNTSLQSMRASVFTALGPRYLKYFKNCYC